ncbi:hypothetical protein Pelo_17776 [Pelomyxa schiedti]|nr:hypothetical protein Pelo_17776 [Pelomyxa schiedti]
MVEVRLTRKESLAILGLSSPPEPSEDDVRGAYRRLAMKWHPDKNENSKESTVMFQKISSAYQCLMTKEEDFIGGMRYVDAIMLYNALIKSLLSPTASSAAAWAMLRTLLPKDTRTPEEMRKAWEEEESNRLLVLHKIDAGFRRNQHPLACAIRENRISEVRSLVQQDPTLPVSELGIFNTPVHFACFYGNKEILDFLLENGGMPALKQMNLDGCTPLEIAKQECHFELTEYLTKRLGIPEQPPVTPPDCFSDRPDWRRHFRKDYKSSIPLTTSVATPTPSSNSSPSLASPNSTAIPSIKPVMLTSTAPSSTPIVTPATTSPPLQTTTATFVSPSRTYTSSSYATYSPQTRSSYASRRTTSSYKSTFSSTRSYSEILEERMAQRASQSHKNSLQSAEAEPTMDAVIPQESLDSQQERRREFELNEERIRLEAKQREEEVKKRQENWLQQEKSRRGLY